MPEGFRKSYDALMDSEWWRLDLPEHLGGTGAPPSLRWAASEMMLGSNPAAFMFMSGPGFAAILDHLGNDDQKRWAAADDREALGRDDGADRARRRLRRGRRPRQGLRQRRRHLAHRGRQAVHHVRRARHDRQHRAPRAGPPRGCRRRHQGPVAVRRAEVLRRPRDRRARRAQRRLRHQRREEDGPEGLHHLRDDLRREGAGHRLARRRRARRHRADVQGHRVRPHDGRHEGHRDAVDRLPQRARLRQDARPGRRPHADDGQDRAARDDHAPPRRATQPDAAEVVRRGHARAHRLHRVLAGHDRAGGGRRHRDRPRHGRCA